MHVAAISLPNSRIIIDRFMLVALFSESRVYAPRQGISGEFCSWALHKYMHNTVSEMKSMEYQRNFPDASSIA
jgi:hypothetical protein